MTDKQIKIKAILFGAGISLLAVGMYGCDVLEPDVAPTTPNVEITGKEIYMASNGTGIIDLNSMIKASGAARLNISRQPQNGKLSKLGNGILQYLPKTDFNKGHDSFEFSIFSKDSSLIGKDSVTIIIEPDSTNLPCGIYPQWDHVNGITGPVYINVLSNDILCGDSSNYAVSIYHPDSSFPPFMGTASVQGRGILYIPGPGFNGLDSIIYKVYNIHDSTKFGIGRVSITPVRPCTFNVYNDNYIFYKDSLHSDTLRLNVFLNDQLCNRALHDYQITLVDDGSVGTAVLNTSQLRYVLPPTMTHTFADSVAYQLCYASRCRTAKAYIKVKY